IIGFFGVGSKRAVVALAQDIKIFTRHEKGKSYQIDIDESWLADDTWEMPVYEIDELPENSTIIDLSKLRIKISEEDEMQLRNHLAETYALFLKRPNFEIMLNNITIDPLEFDEWAYATGFEPRCHTTEIYTTDNKMVGVEIDDGFIRKQDHGSAAHGVR